MITGLKTYFNLDDKNKGLLSEMREKYSEYLKKSLENRESPIEKHLEEIKKKTNFFFYKRKGNFLDIYF